MVDRIKNDGLDPDVITSRPNVTPAAGDQVMVIDATDGELKRALVDSFISGGGSVSSVFGRTGTVVAQAGDYDDSEVSAAASATNYTPTGPTVEGHLAGIDTALGSGGGAVSSVFGRTGAVVAQSGDYDDSEVSAAASATNYTPTASNVEGHLAGIDTALPTAGPISSDAPADGQQYARQNNAWTVVSGGGGGGDVFSWVEDTVGSVILAGSETTDVAYGASVAGSNLRYAELIQTAGGLGNIGINLYGTGLTGTWRCLSRISGSTQFRAVAVFVRIA